MAWLEAQGCRVLRFTHVDVQTSIGGVLVSIQYFVARKRL
jgi:very-short-patch-repair endonuclease